VALKILKLGGEKGDPKCFKVMWDIYSGQTVLDARHDANADLCFGWYLEASNQVIDTSDLGDYLYHSYERLGGDISTWGKKKFSAAQFPGDFASVSIQMWIQRVQQAFQKMQKARLEGLSIDDVESVTDTSEPTISDLIELYIFTSNCVSDGHRIMRRAVAGASKDDLYYCFSKAKNASQAISTYLPYISVKSTGKENNISVNSTSKEDKFDLFGRYRELLNKLFNRST
jgi:hypothetical protein